MEDDLYQAPEVNVLIENEHLGPEFLRERYSRDEVTVLAVGWFYYFFGGLLTAIGCCLLGLALWSAQVIFFVPAAVGLIIGPVYVIVGYGLRCFEPWSRIPGIVAAIVAIAIPPAGTLAGLVCLFLLKQRASKEMFTANYQTAIISGGEVIRHFGWLGLIGGLFSGVTLNVVFFLLAESLF